MPVMFGEPFYFQFYQVKGGKTNPIPVVLLSYGGSEKPTATTNKAEFLGGNTWGIQLTKEEMSNASIGVATQADGFRQLIVPERNKLDVETLAEVIAKSLPVVLRQAFPTLTKLETALTKVLEQYANESS